MKLNAPVVNSLKFLTLLAAAFGLWYVLPTASRTVDSLRMFGGSMLVVSSLALLWESRNQSQDQRRSRVNAVVLLTFGVASLMPSVRVRAVVSITAAILLWAALLRIPRRFFPEPPTPGSLQ